MLKSFLSANSLSVLHPLQFSDFVCQSLAQLVATFPGACEPSLQSIDLLQAHFQIRRHFLVFRGHLFHRVAQLVLLKNRRQHRGEYCLSEVCVIASVNRLCLFSHEHSTCADRPTHPPNGQLCRLFSLSHPLTSVLHKGPSCTTHPSCSCRPRLSNFGSWSKASNVVFGETGTELWSASAFQFETKTAAKPRVRWCLLF